MRSLVLVLIMILGQWAFAASPDPGEIARLLQQRGKEVQKVVLHMIQERESPNGQRVRMEGVIWIRRPDRFRMDVYPPYESITVLKGDEMLIYFPQEKVAQRVNVSRDPSLLRWVQFLKEPWEVVKEKGKVIGEEGREIVLEIDTGDFPELDRVILWIDRDIWFPRKMELEERGGEKAIITYSEIELGAEFTDNVFDLKLPRDVQVTDF